jgi:hypothetical protein
MDRRKVRSRNIMSAAEQEELKRVVKEAVLEALSENSEVLKGLLVGALEDAALLERMEEGRQTEFVGRDEVMRLLEP